MLYLKYMQKNISGRQAYLFLDNALLNV